jgi:hypothetical protein
MELVNFLDKYQKLHIQIEAVTLKVTSCRTMSKKQIWKQGENPRFCGQNKLLFKHLTFQALGSFSHMAARRSFSKNTG